MRSLKSILIVLACGVLGASLAAATAASQPSPHIPMVKGLTLVAAGQMKVGDLESVKQILDVDESGVRFSYSGRIVRHDGTPVKLDVGRRVRQADMRAGRRIKLSYSEMDDEVEPGATSLGISTRVFEELRQGRPVSIWVIDETESGLGTLLQMRIPVTEFKGVLARVEPSPVGVSVVLQGVRVSLPTIHARGRFGEGENVRDGEFWFLDDPENPLLIKLSFGNNRGQLVRIDYPATDDRPLEHTLAKRDTAVVYGILFEFASATLRDESQPVIDEIVTTLSRHPDWTLRIAGHTDSIGGGASNLELSRRRADAVKAALVARGVTASRLATAGYGATQPKESNASLEGRARNRRVELTRN
jgi:hypothetical protein